MTDVSKNGRSNWKDDETIDWIAVNWNVHNQKGQMFKVRQKIVWIAMSQTSVISSNQKADLCKGPAV